MSKLLPDLINIHRKSTYFGDYAKRVITSISKMLPDGAFERPLSKALKVRWTSGRSLWKRLRDASF